MTVLAGHFSGHLRELRNRVLVSFLAIVAATLVAYAFSEQLVRFLMVPLIQSHPNQIKHLFLLRFAENNQALDNLMDLHPNLLRLHVCKE